MYQYGTRPSHKRTENLVQKTEWYLLWLLQQVYDKAKWKISESRVKGLKILGRVGILFFWKKTSILCILKNA